MAVSNKGLSKTSQDNNFELKSSDDKGAHDYVAMQDIATGEEITFDYAMQNFFLIISLVNVYVALKIVVVKLVIGRIYHIIKESSIKAL
jgi:hypothetical protein